MPSVSTTTLANALGRIRGDVGPWINTHYDVSEELGLYDIDDLQDCTIDDELKAITDELNSNPDLDIEEFVLSGPMYSVGDDGTVALAVLFFQNDSIRSLTLSNVRYTGTFGLRALLGALVYNKTATELILRSDDEPFDENAGPDLHKTVLSQICIVELARVFRENCTLEYVCLSPNGLTDDDVVHVLAPALAVNTSIVEIDVSANDGITDFGHQALVEAMGDRGVVVREENMDRDYDTDVTVDETDDDDTDDEQDV